MSRKQEEEEIPPRERDWVCEHHSEEALGPDRPLGVTTYKVPRSTKGSGDYLPQMTGLPFRNRVLPKGHQETQIHPGRETGSAAWKGCRGQSQGLAPRP